RLIGVLSLHSRTAARDFSYSGVIGVGGWPKLTAPTRRGSSRLTSSIFAAPTATHPSMTVSMMSFAGGVSGSGFKEPVINPILTPRMVDSTFAALKPDTVAIEAADRANL